MSTGANVLTVSADPTTTEPASDVKATSLRAQAWRRLKRDKVARICMIVLGTIILLALLAPLIDRLRGVTPYENDFTALDENGGLPIGPFGGVSAKHWLGVSPSDGRDIFSMLLQGARISLMIAGLGTLITLVLGTFFGMLTGYLGGRVDLVIGRLMDLILSFPLTLMLIALTPVVVQRLEAISIFGLQLSGNVSRITYIILALSLFGWPYLARIVRGQVISLREREFVESAVAMGATTPRILRREILPNLWSPLLVYASIALPTYITAEAALSFLGVGILPPEVTWGALLGSSVNYYEVDPALLFIPGTLLFIVVFTFNVLGDAIRDALDPRAARQ
jgi:peptide/nickel transport system permease protein